MKDEKELQKIAQVDQKKKTIKFNTTNNVFIPRFLKYLLEYHRIPGTYKIIFTDKTFDNIEDYINRGDHK